MHTLIIKAHPREDGFTHRIAEAYARKSEEQGNAVTLLDLTSFENAQGFATFADASHILEDESTHRMQDFIREADEIVWIFPVWWFDAPAVMKNFWDRNFTSGFAFRYLPTGKVEKLLTTKTTRVYATAWGPGWLIGFFMGLIWKLWRFGFIGLKVTRFEVFGNFPKRSEAEKQAFLNSL